MTTQPKRLIEIALPIHEISAGSVRDKSVRDKSVRDKSVRDKSVRNGHISSLHLWWARRPLAVVCAPLVSDPDAPNCSPEFRAKALHLLKEHPQRSAPVGPLSRLRFMGPFPWNSVAIFSRLRIRCAR